MVAINQDASFTKLAELNLCTSWPKLKGRVYSIPNKAKLYPCDACSVLFWSCELILANSLLVSSHDETSTEHA